MPIPVCSFEQYLNKRTGSTADYTADLGAQVNMIIAGVRENGDSALRKYTLEFDRVRLENFKVSPVEFEEAQHKVDPDLLKIMGEAAANIEKFHRRQLRRDWYDEDSETLVGQRFLPLNRVGAYVPGGTAAYPSSVLMTVIPAMVAGVKEVCICTPANHMGEVNPLTLAASSLAGVTEVYKIGGAQAIAALAYGTETVPRVDKIVGPGNIYVTLAKKELFGQVGIDMLAGPSEIVIVADADAKASFIAADLLSQAEHDPLSRAILITPSENLAYRVIEELEEQLLSLPRSEIARRSLKDQGAIMIISELSEAWPIVNSIAPEHLELHLKDALSFLDQITSAGSVFIGAWTPEPLGDYWAGANHVLPTGAAARYASALGVDDYLKRQQILYYNEEKLKKSAAKIAELARAEGLEAHARAVLIRGKSDESPGKG